MPVIGHNHFIVRVQVLWEEGQEAPLRFMRENYMEEMFYSVAVELARLPFGSHAPHAGRATKRSWVLEVRISTLTFGPRCCCIRVPLPPDSQTYVGFLKGCTPRICLWCRKRRANITAVHHCHWQAVPITFIICMHRSSDTHAW